MVARVCVLGGGGNEQHVEIRQINVASGRKKYLQQRCADQKFDRLRVKRQKARELSSAGRQVGVTRS